MAIKPQHILIVKIFTLVYWCLCSISSATEDYAAYAREQQEKSKTLIAPYQAEVQKIIRNVKKRQMQPDIQVFKKEMQDVAQKQCPMRALMTQQEAQRNSEQSPIIIFVSFSMPKESIKGWIKEAERANASVYIRGLVNNSFKDTAKAVSELVNEQNGGLLIDPDLFKKFSITQVPAVVVVNNAGFDVVYGDVPLAYALEKIRNIAPQDINRLTQIIKKIRGLSQNV